MQSSDGLMGGLPRPGKALVGVMVAITALWLMFAIGLNWGGAPASVFVALAGNSRDILHGEVWRLFTAPLLLNPRGLGHLISALLGLYFLAPRLEQLWGAARMLRFLALTGVLAYVLQMLAELALPATVAARMVGPYWFGPDPALAAIVIAWACTFRGQPFSLFGLLPMTSRTLILLTVGFAVLQVVAAELPPAGLLAPFGGMFFGWLLGGGTPSPLRKAWLKLRLAQLEDANRKGERKKPRPNPGGLRVIPGGRTDDDDTKGPDGRWLN